ncbi:MAG: hypothetical protein AB1816_04620 [Bacillota bacterium]
MRVIVKLAAGLVVAAVVLGAASYAVPRLGLAGKLPPAAREALARLPWAGAAVPKEPEKPVEYVPSPLRVPIGAKAEELTPEQVAVLYEYYQLTAGVQRPGNFVVAERDLVSPSIRDLSQVEWEEALKKSAEEHGLRDIWEPMEIRVADKCLEPDSLGRIWVVVEVDARVTYAKDYQAQVGHKGAVITKARQKYVLVQRNGVWYITAPRDGIEVHRGWIASWID